MFIGVLLRMIIVYLRMWFIIVRRRRILIHDRAINVSGNISIKGKLFLLYTRK